MLEFWLIAGLLLFIPMIVIVSVLLKKPDIRQTEVHALDSYNQRLLELETDVTNGLINDREIESIKKELQLSILNQDKITDKQIGKTVKRKKTILTACIVILLLPVFTISLYQHLGNPRLIQQAALLDALNTDATDATQSAAIEKMLAMLEEHLIYNADDVDGWLMLTNAYISLERYLEALGAIKNLYRLKSNDPTVMLRYADILSVVNNGVLQGKPTELIDKAMQIDPENSTGLWLAGLAAIQRGEINNAIRYWENLLARFAGGMESKKQIQDYIKLARDQSINADRTNDNGTSSE